MMLMSLCSISGPESEWWDFKDVPGRHRLGEHNASTSRGCGRALRRCGWWLLCPSDCCQW
jgi:hypothetical protein